MLKSHVVESAIWPIFAHRLNFRESRWRGRSDHDPRRPPVRKSVGHRRADLRIRSPFPTLLPSNRFSGIRLKVVAGPPLAIACHKALGEFPRPLAFVRDRHDIRFVDE